MKLHLTPNRYLCTIGGRQKPDDSTLTMDRFFAVHGSCHGQWMIFDLLYRRALCFGKAPGDLVYAGAELAYCPLQAILWGLGFQNINPTHTTLPCSVHALCERK